MDLQETKFLPKFGQLEKDCSPLVPGPLCFFLIELLKKKCVDKNNKIKILRTFDNTISKNRIQNKRVSYLDWLFWTTSQIRKEF